MVILPFVFTAPCTQIHCSTEWEGVCKRIEPEDLPVRSLFILLSGEKQEMELRPTRFLFLPISESSHLKNFNTMKKMYVVAALIISSPSFAQKDSSKTMDEVVVTATKFPKNVNETGKVVTVIDHTTIERS